MIWYKIADVFFLIFHLLLILFNLTGWIWASTRKWHLAAIILTIGSWTVLGIFYGWGYCPLTDWHWSVLKELGKYDLPNSYITYLVSRVLNITPPGEIVDALTVLFAVAALLLSLWYNFFKTFRNRHKGFTGRAE